jgi:hypothetical protein
LYWATHRENTFEDGTKFGTYKTPWEHMVAKYGLEEAKKLNSRLRKGNTFASVNKGRTKTEEHKKKLAESMCKFHGKVYVSIEELVERVLNSQVDFSKLGWRKHIAIILDIALQNVTKWMKRNMKQFYEEHCFSQSKK